MKKRLSHDVTAICPAIRTRARTEVAFHKTPLLIVTDVHSDINQYLSLASCHVLVPRMDCCPDLVNIISIPCSTHVLVPVTVHPLLPYIILWRLPSDTGIHFVLESPKTCLVCMFPLVNSINYQIGVASLFSLSLPPPPPHGGRFFSLGTFPWVCVY